MAATTINIDAYSDALVVLATAEVVVPLVRRWGLSAVLGYLGAGDRDPSLVGHADGRRDDLLRALTDMAKPGSERCTALCSSKPHQW
jgi:hypothetical protein